MFEEERYVDDEHKADVQMPSWVICIDALPLLTLVQRGNLKPRGPSDLSHRLKALPVH